MGISAASNVSRASNKQLTGVGVMVSKSNNRSVSFSVSVRASRLCGILAFLLVLASWHNAAHAQAAEAKGVKQSAACDPMTDSTCKPIPAAEGEDPFRGLKWGVGVAYSSSLGGVGKVTLDPGTRVVRVTQQNAGAARGLFEVHCYFKLCNGFRTAGYIYLPDRYDSTTRNLECRSQWDPQFAMGPFVSLNTNPFDTSGNYGNNKVFSSVGMGWMLGLNAYDGPLGAPYTKLHTINFGVGAIIDTAVNSLAPGVVDGQVTTVDQSLLTRQVTKTGWMLLLSYKLFDVNLK
jgi:hypothetical protein